MISGGNSTCRGENRSNNSFAVCISSNLFSGGGKSIGNFRKAAITAFATVRKRSALARSPSQSGVDAARIMAARRVRKMSAPTSLPRSAAFIRSSAKLRSTRCSVSWLRVLPASAAAARSSSTSRGLTRKDRARERGSPGCLSGRPPLFFTRRMQSHHFQGFCIVYRRRNLDKGKTVQYGGYVGGSTYKTWRFGMADQDPERRVQVSVHLEEALREQLEAAARRSVRSLSGEITFRLKRSLECDSQIDSDAA